VLELGLDRQQAAWKRRWAECRKARDRASKYVAPTRMPFSGHQVLPWLETARPASGNQLPMKQAGKAGCDRALKLDARVMAITKPGHQARQYRISRARAVA